MRAAWALATVAVAAVVGGCILVTGDATGYSATKACTKNGDCPGQVCCLTVDAGSYGAGCQAACPAEEQPCSASTDCGDGGQCLVQQCTVMGATVQVTTCGAISICAQ